MTDRISVEFTFLEANQAIEALDSRLAYLYERQRALRDLDGYGIGFEGAVDDDAIRWTEGAKRAVSEALYPDPPEQADPITMALGEYDRVANR